MMFDEVSDLKFFDMFPGWIEQQDSNPRLKLKAPQPTVTLTG
jgi:hypothetical protein